MLTEPLHTRRLELFPESTCLKEIDGHTVLHIAGQNLEELALTFGTPLYIYDQAMLDASLQEYRSSLSSAYPGPHGLTYAGKAYLCTAVAQWAMQRGIWVDCTGVGEVAIALASGLPPASIVVHGVNKSLQDLQAATEHAGTIVVDNSCELEQMVALIQRATRLSLQPFPDLWLRLRPGIAVDTHAHTQTGQSESKFGTALEDALELVKTCKVNHLPLTGLHFHLGSQFRDPAPVRSALETVLDFVLCCREEHGWLPQVISPGGGWGVPYHEDQLPYPPAEGYVRFISNALAEGCIQRNLPLPRLHLEPGRGLVARAGVALYRVGAIKKSASRRWLMIDGGMADNPRPALYGARYTALPVTGSERQPYCSAWIGGPYCESGDALIEDLPMPEIAPGELIAIPVSGAYQLSMSSNYNGAMRPAVVWLNGSGAHLIQDRETPDRLVQRDRPLPE